VLERDPAQAIDYAVRWANAETSVATALPAHLCAAAALARLGDHANAAKTYAEVAVAYEPRSTQQAVLAWRAAGRANAAASAVADDAGRSLDGRLLDGSLDRALIAFDRALALALPVGISSPTDAARVAELQYERGVVLGLRGDWLAALAAAEAAVQGGVEAGRLLRARAARNMQWWDRAASDIAAYLQLRPLSADALLERAYLRMALQQMADAEDDLQVIVQTARGSPAGRVARHLLETGALRDGGAAAFGRSLGGSLSGSQPGGPPSGMHR
jgi:tetratricopeptide (TPR) repeat protein